MARRRVAGYLRKGARCGHLPAQRELIDTWAAKHCLSTVLDGVTFHAPSGSDGARDRLRRLRKSGDPSKYEWFRYAIDKESTQSRYPLLYREEITRLARDLDPGDTILIPWFGVLCEDLEDAIEGLPSILGRGVRVYVCSDRYFLRSSHVRMFRSLRREWYVNTTSRTPLPPGVSPPTAKKHYVRPHNQMLGFMQYCWRKSILEGLPEHLIYAEARELWKHRPLTKQRAELRGAPKGQRSKKHLAGDAGRPLLTLRHVSEAIRAYQDVLGAIWSGRKMPHWVKEAQTGRHCPGMKKFFTETQADIRNARLEVLRRKVKAASKREKT